MWCKAEFSAAVMLVHSVTWSFRNHSNMLICFSRNISYHYQGWKWSSCLLFLLNMKCKVQKNSFCISIELTCLICCSAFASLGWTQSFFQLVTAASRGSDGMVLSSKLTKMALFGRRARFWAIRWSFRRRDCIAVSLLIIGKPTNVINKSNHQNTHTAELRTAGLSKSFGVAASRHVKIQYFLQLTCAIHLDDSNNPPVCPDERKSEEEGKVERDCHRILSSQVCTKWSCRTKTSGFHLDRCETLGTGSQPFLMNQRWECVIIKETAHQ